MINNSIVPQVAVNMQSRLGQKMVRKYAMLVEDQRYELLDLFERPAFNERYPSTFKNGIESSDVGAWDSYGEELSNEAKESNLTNLGQDFVDWLVFDKRGEQLWKSMKPRRER